jgi:hypothetical protein
MVLVTFRSNPGKQHNPPLSLAVRQIFRGAEFTGKAAIVNSPKMRKNYRLLVSIHSRNRAEFGAG